MKHSLRTLPVVLLATAFIIPFACRKTTRPEPAAEPEPVYSLNEIYHYTFTSMEGKAVKISDFKGKKIMFVNTASYCSNTPQYEKLENLYKDYGSKLAIIGFPCNQFGGQDPGSNEDIKNFCTGTYHITFPLSQKIDVQGAKQDSIYAWLTKKELNGKLSSSIAWNFQKYLVDEKGNFMEMFANDMQPDDPSIITMINK